ncbi:MAG TPA: DegT/DnrJ/EryC1/StrS family aminotransferase, partial [Aggregatilineaceae bacterium]|nr:DegT/DnrJ/EryC1/StrS family aminotransferase [Aggregatilineaceae bacterium]
GWGVGLLCGRGTTALWLALRAIGRRDGLGEVILPDLLCETALHGVLLAGFTPVFADVSTERFTMAAESVAKLVTARTRAIVVVHLFGHMAELDRIRGAAPGVPIIEDAVQGLGGTTNDKPAGAGGDISFISFDPNKMVRGRGGMVLVDDETLVDGMRADLRKLPHVPDTMSGVDTLLHPRAAAAYGVQLRAFAPTLLQNFDDTQANVERILADWDTLHERVEVRNRKARWLEAHLAGVPVGLPELREGDAIWRYTITVPRVVLAQRIMRQMQAERLNVAGLYYPLSQFFGRATHAHALTNRLANLAVDEAADEGALQRMVEIIHARA